MTSASATKIIEAQGLSKRFVRQPDLAERLLKRVGAGHAPSVVHAVDNVSLAIAGGEVVGLVGESGCGKSTLGRMIAGLLQPSEGEVLFKGKDRATLAGTEAKAARLAVQMIFQDPYASLNPRKRVETIIGEAPLVHGLVPRSKLCAFVGDMLKRVGLDAGFKGRYPHQFSGGQRSRIGIARALAVSPEFLVCDEAIAALDVSIQAQIIALLKGLCREHGTAVMLITHDMGVIAETADRVAVMYAGRVVEVGPVADIIHRPQHPYTKGLMGSIPSIVAERENLAQIDGVMPRLDAIPAGCAFHPRCPYAFDRCKRERPELMRAGATRSACWLVVR
jgi:oligopeptide/dipeptide ABC transporter ATP-binding protein